MIAARLIPFAFLFLLLATSLSAAVPERVRIGDDSQLLVYWQGEFNTNEKNVWAVDLGGGHRLTYSRPLSTHSGGT
jgi:hypothetical protein